MVVYRSLCAATAREGRGDPPGWPIPRSGVGLDKAARSDAREGVVSVCPFLENSTACRWSVLCCVVALLWACGFVVGLFLVG